MIEGNQIDDLFEASLNGLQAKPSMSAWDKLDQELDAIDSASASFDEEVNQIMQDFKAQPSNAVWDGLNSHLEAAAAAAISFDKSAEESMKDIYQLPSENVWNNIETELDYIEAANIEAKKRFVLWFSLSTTVAASLLFFFMHFSPKHFFNLMEHEKSPLVNNIVIDNLKDNADNEIPKKINSVVNNKYKYVNSDIVEQIIPDKTNNSKKKKSINQSSNIVIAKSDNRSKEKENLDISKVNDGIVEETIMADNYEINNMSSSNLSYPDGLSPLDLLAETNIRLKSLNAATGFSLDLFVGPELIINQTEQNSSVGDKAIIEEIKPACTDYTFGANIKFHYNKFFVQSGLTYSNYGDQRLYQKNTEMHDTSGGFYSYTINTYITYDTIGWVDDPLEPGGIAPVLSANFHSDTLGQQWKSQDSIYYTVDKYSAKNRYRYLEIPVMLGYKFYHKDWGFSLAAGVSYGFKIAEQGKYIDNEGTLKTAFTTSSPYSDFTTNGIVSLGISYSITNKLSVILQPTYKTNLQELNNLSVSYKNVSLRMGINIML